MKNFPAPTCIVSAYLRRTKTGTPLIKIRLITAQAAEFRTYHPEADGVALDCQAVGRALARALQSASIPCAWLWLRLPLGKNPKAQEWDETSSGREEGA